MRTDVPPMLCGSARREHEREKKTPSDQVLWNKTEQKNHLDIRFNLYIFCHILFFFFFSFSLIRLRLRKCWNRYSFSVGSVAVESEIWKRWCLQIFLVYIESDRSWEVNILNHNIIFMRKKKLNILGRQSKKEKKIIATSRKKRKKSLIAMQ